MGGDMVVEELVEGGLSRLAAFFYSTLPQGLVGPARSMRATDIGIVKPVDAILVGSGGAPRTLARIDGGQDHHRVGERRKQGFRPRRQPRSRAVQPDGQPADARRSLQAANAAAHLLLVRQ